MQEDVDIVAKKIESGQYFSEAMSWFHAKFTKPRSELSFLTIIAFIAILALLAGFATFSEIFPLAPGQNIAISQPVTPKLFKNQATLLMIHISNIWPMNM